tara:strand:+ start:83907 stop:85094 length:1188 start_codon:yes stop_codon:yes gene_type:complete
MNVTKALTESLQAKVASTEPMTGAIRKSPSSRNVASQIVSNGNVPRAIAALVSKVQIANVTYNLRRISGLFLAATMLVAAVQRLEAEAPNFSESGPRANPVGQTETLEVYSVGTIKADRSSIILLDPILFAPGILGREDGLIQSFEDHNVYILMWKNHSPIQTTVMGTEIEKAISLVRTDCECNQFVAGGVSLGGQRWLPYLGRLEPSGEAMQDPRGNRIYSVFFLGSGLDYAYPGSLYRSPSFPVGEDLSNQCLNLTGPCLGFIDTRHIKAGLQLRTIPESVVPDDLGAVRMFPSIREMSIPVAFIFGKIDGFSPEETLYPVFSVWGEKTYLQKLRKQFSPYDTDNPVLWLEGSEANRIHDYDHFDLFLHPDAEDEIYEELVDWIEDAKRKPTD